MIWIAGGGTGGHLFPALHIAREIGARHPKVAVHLIGARRGLEAQILPDRSWTYSLLPVAGNVRGGGFERVSFYARLGLSLMTCEWLYRKARPTLVLGTGGYASFPAAQIAAWHGVPLFWQEQNAGPGEVTRRMAASCKKVFAGYPGLEEKLSQTEVMYTGNPVQADIAKGDRARGRQTGRFSREDIVLLVLGGSGGAASINRAIARIAGTLNQKGNIRIWWQTGTREYEEWKSRITPELFPGTMCPFIENMADAYAAADLVVARAGAMTTAEICASGKPAVLVPFPRAAGNHQLHNAKVLVDRGAALWVLDEELETEKLAETLLCLASDRTQQARLAASARRLGRPDAAANIVDVLEEYL